jgi:hypothetical protein
MASPYLARGSLRADSYQLPIKPHLTACFWVLTRRLSLPQRGSRLVAIAPSPRIPCPVGAILYATQTVGLPVALPRHTRIKVVVTACFLHSNCPFLPYLPRICSVSLPYLSRMYKGRKGYGVDREEILHILCSTYNKRGLNRQERFFVYKRALLAPLREIPL